jgi:nicotinamide mononucleotide transporter
MGRGKEEDVMERIKRYFATWSVFELVWVAISLAVAVGLTIGTESDFFGFLTFLSGVLCVVFIAKGSLISFWLGYFNILSYAWIAWQSGLFGEVGLNILFFLPINIVGHVLWHRNIQSNGALEIRRMRWQSILASLLFGLVGTLLLGWGLSCIGGQQTPYLDALTNVMSIVAFILMSLRYREQWIYWIVLDLFTVTMWGIRWYHGTPQAALMVMMWGTYLGNGVFGWLKWSKEATASAVKN